MILKTLLIAIVFSITACTSKVHVRLFTANLSSEDATKIQKKLQSSKLRYSVTETPFPKRIATNSIIYTPKMGANKQLDKLIGVLESAGFPVSWISLLKVENHSFTANNMGLYLFSDGYAPVKGGISPFDIKEYGSTECGSHLMLNNDSTFSVVFETWDYELEDYRESLVVGLWHEQSQNHLILSSDKWQSELSFEKKINFKSAEFGDLTTVRLIPLSNSKEGNSYLKEPNSEPSVNCEYWASFTN